MKLKKDEGLTQYVLATILILIAALLIIYGFSMRKINMQKQEIEDGITSSALASAIIDLNEYGTYKYIRSNNGRGTGSLANSQNKWGSAEDNLLNIFRENLATNLKLNPATLTANEDSIIDGEVKITRFWVYNHELIESTGDDGQPIMIKDYKGRWIKQHEETDRWYIYKYDITPSGRYNKTAELAATEADGFVYTPKDDHIVFADGDIVGSGTDGAGGGHVKVDSMTIYATIEFYVKPFGYGLYNNWGIYDGAKFENSHEEEYQDTHYNYLTEEQETVTRKRFVYDQTEGSDIDEVGKIKIIKSVVVDVQPIESTP